MTQYILTDMLLIDRLRLFTALAADTSTMTYEIICELQYEELYYQRLLAERLSLKTTKNDTSALSYTVLYLSARRARQLTQSKRLVSGVRSQFAAPQKVAFASASSLSHTHNTPPIGIR